MCSCTQLLHRHQELPSHGDKSDVNIYVKHYLIYIYILYCHFLIRLSCRVSAWSKPQQSIRRYRMVFTHDALVYTCNVSLPFPIFFLHFVYYSSSPRYPVSRVRRYITLLSSSGFLPFVFCSSRVGYIVAERDSSSTVWFQSGVGSFDLSSIILQSIFNIRDLFFTRSCLSMRVTVVTSFKVQTLVSRFALCVGHLGAVCAVYTLPCFCVCYLRRACSCLLNVLRFSSRFIVCVPTFAFSG